MESPGQPCKGRTSALINLWCYVKVGSH